MVPVFGGIIYIVITINTTNYYDKIFSPYRPSLIYTWHWPILDIWTFLLHNINIGIDPKHLISVRPKFTPTFQKLSSTIPSSENCPVQLSCISWPLSASACPWIQIMLQCYKDKSSSNKQKQIHLSSSIIQQPHSPKVPRHDTLLHSTPEHGDLTTTPHFQVWPTPTTDCLEPVQLFISLLQAKGRAQQLLNPRP